MRTPLVALAMCTLAGLSQAQTWPVKPVRWIIPNSAGSGPDTVTRLAATQLEQILKQPFLIENRPGGNFFIAAEATARAAPDGYTIGLGSGVLSAINPNLFKQLPYDPDKDFDYIAMMVDTVWIMVAAHSSFPANNFAELIQAAKKNPGKYSYQVTVPVNGMYFRWLSKKLGASLLEVEYKSTPTAVQDALSGRTDIIVNSITPYEAHIKAGKIKVLGMSPETPLPGYEKVQKISEVLPNGDMGSWIGLIAPRGVPPDMVRRLNEAMDRIVRDPEFQKRLLALGWANRQGARNPKAMAEHALAERARWAEIARDAGVTPQ